MGSEGALIGGFDFVDGPGLGAVASGEREAGRLAVVGGNDGTEGGIAVSVRVEHADSLPRIVVRKQAEAWGRGLYAGGRSGLKRARRRDRSASGSGGTGGATVR